LTVDFVACTLAVKKKLRAGFDLSDRTIALSVGSSQASFTFKASHGIHYFNQFRDRVVHMGALMKTIKIALKSLRYANFRKRDGVEEDCNNVRVCIPYGAPDRDANSVKRQIHPSLKSLRLRHYATSRKVAGSIPNEVTGFFN
jgi:hypothetical protein